MRNEKLYLYMVVIDELGNADKERKWEELKNIKMNKNSF